MQPEQHHTCMRRTSPATTVGGLSCSGVWAVEGASVGSGVIVENVGVGVGPVPPGEGGVVEGNNGGTHSERRGYLLWRYERSERKHTKMDTYINQPPFSLAKHNSVQAAAKAAAAAACHSQFVQETRGVYKGGPLTQQVRIVDTKRKTSVKIRQIRQATSDHETTVDGAHWA